MMNHKQFAAILVATAAMLLMAGCSTETPTTLQATATDAVKSVDRYEISGQLLIGEDIDPGEVRNPGGRVTIIKGNAFAVELTGDIIAAAVFTQDARWNALGNGSITGRAELEEAELRGVTGELEGQFAASVREYWMDANVVLQGRDELAGVHVRMHLEGMVDSDTFDYTGVVLIDDRDWYEVEPDGAIRPNF